MKSQLQYRQPPSPADLVCCSKRRKLARYVREAVPTGRKHRCRMVAIRAHTWRICMSWRAKRGQRSEVHGPKCNLSKAGWNCGCISSTDHKGRQFWVVAAERSDAGRFIVRADEMRTAFLELQAAIYRRFEPQMESHA
jgi:hypothetical protein